MDGLSYYNDKAQGALIKIHAMMNEPGGEKMVKEFSFEAKRYLINLTNNIEANLQFGGRFQYAKDHGSKLAENIARVSANLSCHEHGEDAEISLGILMDAERIVMYFSDCYLRCLQAQPDYVRDAIELSEYLQSVREDGARYVRKNKIRQSGPSRVRNKAALDQAIINLAQQGELQVVTCHNGMLVLDLYPSFPFDVWQWNEFCFKNKLNMTVQAESVKTEEKDDG